jgi:protein TonB
MPTSQTSGRFLLASVLIHAMALSLWHVDVTRLPAVHTGGALRLVLPTEQSAAETIEDPAVEQPELTAQPAAQQSPAADSDPAKTPPTSAPLESLASDRTARPRPAHRDSDIATRSLAEPAVAKPAPAAMAMKGQSHEPAKTDQQAVANSTLQLVLETRMAQYFSYPRLAQRRNWQGEVRLGLRVEANGRLSHIRVIKSSGFAILDEAALASLRQVTTIPLAGHWLRGKSFDTVLPVKYRLLDS